MTADSPNIAFSNLSRQVTLDGLTVEVRIYRLEPSKRWTMVVINDIGVCTIWDEPFETDTLALAAFEMTVQEEGMACFVERDDAVTLH